MDPNGKRKASAAGDLNGDQRAFREDGGRNRIQLRRGGCGLLLATRYVTRKARHGVSAQWWWLISVAMIGEIAHVGNWSAGSPLEGNSRSTPETRAHHRPTASVYRRMMRMNKSPGKGAGSDSRQPSFARDPRPPTPRLSLTAYQLGLVAGLRRRGVPGAHCVDESALLGFEVSPTRHASHEI